SEHADLAHFAGTRVVVIGGGQSALESAVLLAEAAADAEMIMRAPRLRWVGRATRQGMLGRLLFHRTDVGPALVSQIVARPMLVRRLPVPAQRQFTRRSLAAGAALGLDVLGAPAVHSFGPLVRFVAGTDFAVRRLASVIAGRARHAPLKDRRDRAREYQAAEERAR